MDLLKNTFDDLVEGLEAEKAAMNATNGTFIPTLPTLAPLPTLPPNLLNLPGLNKTNSNSTEEPILPPIKLPVIKLPPPKPLFTGIPNANLEFPTIKPIIETVQTTETPLNKPNGLKLIFKKKKEYEKSADNAKKQTKGDTSEQEINSKSFEFSEDLLSHSKSESDVKKTEAEEEIKHPNVKTTNSPVTETTTSVQPVTDESKVQMPNDSEPTTTEPTTETQYLDKSDNSDATDTSTTSPKSKNTYEGEDEEGYKTLKTFAYTEDALGFGKDLVLQKKKTKDQKKNLKVKKENDEDVPDGFSKLAVYNIDDEENFETIPAYKNYKEDVWGMPTIINTTETEEDSDNQNSSPTTESAEFKIIPAEGPTKKAETTKESEEDDFYEEPSTTAISITDTETTRNEDRGKDDLTHEIVLSKEIAKTHGALLEAVEKQEQKDKHDEEKPPHDTASKVAEKEKNEIKAEEKEGNQLETTSSPVPSTSENHTSKTPLNAADEELKENYVFKIPVGKTTLTAEEVRIILKTEQLMKAEKDRKLKGKKTDLLKAIKGTEETDSEGVQESSNNTKEQTQSNMVSGNETQLKGNVISAEEKLETSASTVTFYPKADAARNNHNNESETEEVLEYHPIVIKLDGFDGRTDQPDKVQGTSTTPANESSGNEHELTTENEVKATEKPDEQSTEKAINDVSSGNASEKSGIEDEQANSNSRNETDMKINSTKELTNPEEKSEGLEMKKDGETEEKSKGKIKENDQEEKADEDKREELKKEETLSDEVNQLLNSALESENQANEVVHNESKVKTAGTETIIVSDRNDTSNGQKELNNTVHYPNDEEHQNITAGEGEKKPSEQPEGKASTQAPKVPKSDDLGTTDQNEAVKALHSQDKTIDENLREMMVIASQLLNESSSEGSSSTVGNHTAKDEKQSEEKIENFTEVAVKDIAKQNSTDVSTTTDGPIETKSLQKQSKTDEIRSKLKKTKKTDNVAQDQLNEEGKEQAYCQ